MLRWGNAVALAVSGIFGISCLASGQTSGQAKEELVDQARQALEKRSTDTDTEKAIEEVFQAVERRFSLLKKGGLSLNYGFDYSYFADNQIDVEVENLLTQQGAAVPSITRFNIEQDAEHTFTNTFTVDYGLLDNLTLSARLPFVSKFDTSSDINTTALGDLSFSLRWQPFPLERGRPTLTFFGSLGTKTGESPYEINVGNDLSTGDGFYSLNAGASISKILDPVVLFGSFGVTYNFEEKRLDQLRGNRILQAVDPGEEFSLTLGMSYSISYDVTLSASYQQSFVRETELTFFDGRTTETASTNNQTSGVMLFSLGLRLAPSYIANFNVGFGLTEDSPDLLLGTSLPIDFQGLKNGLLNRD